VPYYGAGDYYTGRGDYYRGRGDLGGFLKRVGRGAVGFITGGVPGAIGGFVGGASQPSRTSVQFQSPIGGGFEFERTTGARGSASLDLSRDGACPRGFHPAKDGSGKCVRNRRMNVGNARALMRAVRRQEGFVSLAKRMGMRMPPGKKILRPSKGRKR
jgi:hypothetical protein